MTTEQKALMYGSDLALLEIRRLLFEHEGYSVDTCQKAQDFMAKAESVHSYKHFIICYTVPEEEHAVIKRIADEQQIAIYFVEPVTPPAAMVAHLAAL
jgi:hypothetical protein